MKSNNQPYRSADNSDKDSYWKERSETIKRWFDGLPVILVENCKPLKDRLDKVRVGEDVILEAARELQGLERMDQIKYAVMESNGIISIIPKDAKTDKASS